MKAELDGTRLNTALMLTSTSSRVTRVRPRPIRFRYQTGPRLLDDGALWRQTEHAPRRPVKGQR